MTRIVLVPGAWHLPTHYSALSSALSRQGHIVDCIAHTVIGSVTATVQNDAEEQRKLMLALIDAGHDIVVLAHSYGGMVAGIAAAGLSKASRQQSGQTGGVIGLLYMCSFVMPESMTLNQATGGKPHAFVQVMGASCEPRDPGHFFYTDCKQSDIEVAVKLIKPQSAKFLTSSSETVPAWKEAEFQDRRAYLICLRDQALPAEAQRAMTEGWDVAEIDTGHSPFLSRTEETAAWIERKIEQFRR